MQQGSRRAFRRTIPAMRTKPRAVTEPGPRGRPRRVFAFAALAVPLAVLALFGSAELGRQTERAEQALTDQARAYLQEARRELDTQLARADELLGALPDVTLVRAAAAARILRDVDPAALDLLLIGSGGDLLFPRRAPDEAGSRPFQRPSTVPAIRRAEALERRGEVESARDLLEKFVERIPADVRTGEQVDAAIRAHFRLAVLHRTARDLDDAEEHFLIAAVEATAPVAGSESAAARATVALWCETALAELDVESGRGTERAVEIAGEIADGVHDGAPELVLDGVFARLAAACEADPIAADAILFAREIDIVRREGREFAAAYDAFLRESARRRLERSSDDADLVQFVHAMPGGASLFALRRTTDHERLSNLDELPDPTWIGVRMDLERLLADALADRLDAGARPFALVVSDTEGAPIAPAVPGEDASGLQARAELTADAGLRMSAFPVDSEALLAERGRSFRNRALLVLLLCATAAGGALLLVRSVQRESEIADLKVALVSRVTHDLKTPLALIRMYAETIGRGRARTPEETARFAGIVEREADVLTRMVERVLDFSRKEAGTLTYEPRVVDLAPTLRMLADAYRPHAEARGIPLRVELPQSEAEVHVDASAFQSAVLDLLENATKYTPAEATDREIVLALAAADGRAIVEVRDRGPGIPEGERERVFESFVRGSNAGESRGAGLGLSLVRHFARAHGGEAEARPRSGGGTTMRLELPLASGREKPSVDSARPGT